MTNNDWIDCTPRQRTAASISLSVAWLVLGQLSQIAGAANVATDAELAPSTTPVFEVEPVETPIVSAGYFFDQELGVVPRLMEERDGLLVIEGDIVIGPAEQAKVAGNAKGLTDLSAKLWSKGVVPYELPANFPRRDLVLKAFDEYNQRTKIRFVEKKPAHNDYLKFTVTHNPNVGGQSNLGRIGGEQPLWLNSDTSKWTTGTVIHELGHALGMMHEQCRRDRDEYVEVIKKNIKPFYLSQFDPLPYGKDLGSYDYESIQHYPSTAFAKEPGLITIKPKTVGVQIGQRTRLSNGDIANLEKRYAAQLTN